MRELKSKWRLFRFEDGTLLDVSKIDFITKSEKDENKYIIQISGKQISLDKDYESERLIETWDLWIRNEEQNSEAAYLQGKLASNTIDVISHKIDFILAMYSRVNKDVIPEYPLGNIPSDKKDENKTSD